VVGRTSDEEAGVNKATRLSNHFGFRIVTTLALSGLAAACSSNASSGPSSETEELGGSSDAVTTEDGLADAYTLFKSQFVGSLGFDKTFVIGYGFHPGISRRN
jgi:hypothetical protein